MKEKFQRYLHADADMFFAAVEMHFHPEWKDKALIIGHPYSRSVVSTASYEARKYGVHSGMPMQKAIKLCPQSIVVPPDHRRYGEISQKMFRLFRNFADSVAELSIDEGVMEISSSLMLFGGEEALALQLKEVVSHALGITVSIGIANTRILAKIAAGKHKPNGLTIVLSGHEKEFLKNLLLKEVPGIGSKTLDQLGKKGLNTIGDCYQYSLKEITEQLGHTGLMLWNLYHAREESMKTAKQPSISREITFLENQYSETIIKKTLLKLSKDLGFTLRKRSMQASTIGIKLRFPPFETITRQKTLDKAISSDLDIFQQVCLLYHPFLRRELRLIGISLSKLSSYEDLYSDDNTRQHILDHALDSIRKKHGKNKIKRLMELS